jgi:hypothetical protein
VGITTAKAVQSVVDTIFQKGEPAISVVRRWALTPTYGVSKPDFSEISLQTSYHTYDATKFPKKSKI